MSLKNSGIGEMLRLGLILVCYAVVSCAVLAVVNNFTAPKIAQNQIDKANEAMRQVFESADSFAQISDFEPASTNAITISDFYLAKKDGKVIGGVAQVSGPTYDKGKIIVGIDTNGTITGMQVLELSDSPGFGLKANDSTFKLPSGKTFYGQFTGKSAINGFKDGSNFDAISGATITSKGLGDMVSEGTQSLIKYMKEHDYE
ncbi:FMN-binding protein [Treponema sp. Marseille-Q3903]|uniref:FMN-binding protein n=1 Tax=Treponema sp. Marseille-Q3903 TaxID=2766703 RepID=UPI00165271ED|nr:FMN-binding protein [Treponema sp. Marseille-Q3903]MBC6713743.1 FMN-binding protein [Treponema sp. Marseille-Q3903]